MADSVVCPGDTLGPADVYISGSGTYIRNGQVIASIVGVKHTNTQTEGESGSNGKLTIEVLPKTEASPIVPKPGSVVTVKITRVQQMSASCVILCVGPQALAQEFRGIIRHQDVRATEIDKVVMPDCFRPGDIVRAEVLSLGDARSYYLTTAKNEYGVVYAKSTSGTPMVAVSWEAMQDPATMAVEKRKVAKTEAKAE